MMNNENLNAMEAPKYGIAEVLFYRRQMVREVNILVNELTNEEGAVYYKQLTAKVSATLHAHMHKRLAELLSLIYKPYF